MSVSVEKSVKMKIKTVVPNWTRNAIFFINISEYNYKQYSINTKKLYQY